MDDHAMSKGKLSISYRSMLDNLSALRAYVAVVESGSFSEAGYRLNVMPSTISKHVSFLEEKIRGQLIVRSTKHLSISELGQRFYERCLTILREVDETEAELLEYQMEPQGKLRVSAGPTFAGFHLPKIMPGFLEQYPKVNVELRITAEVLDLIDNSIDIAIRISSNLDPGLIAVKLAPNVRTMCVAPAYLERFGRPETLEDLHKHNCILSSAASSAAKWAFLDPQGKESAVHVTGNLVVNDGNIYHQALLDGIGIGYLSRYLVFDDIKAGRLIELFPDQQVVTSNIYVVCPQRKNLPLKTRAFIDHLRHFFRNTPEWLQ